MKWTFVIQQKLKAAAVLSSIMLMIVFFTFLERKNIADMNKSVTSIYADRLIPATDIFYLSEQLYGKRFLMENYLSAEHGLLPELRVQLGKHNQEIQAIIRRFEKTYLVDEESRYLKDLKNKIVAYGRLETEILRLSEKNSRAEALALYQSEGRKDLQQANHQLALLTKVQTNVGGELIKDSNGKVASLSMISSLQIVLSIITGLIVLAIIFSSQITSKTEHNFHLN